MPQETGRFRVCGANQHDQVHFHVYGATPDARCCAQQQRLCRRPSRTPCYVSFPAHVVVLAEARVPPLPMRGFALLALPRDVLAHVLAVHLDALDRYALVHVCRALCALYAAPASDAWRFRVWHDAMATARDTALLAWSRLLAGERLCTRACRLHCCRLGNTTGCGRARRCATRPRCSAGSNVTAWTSARYVTRRITTYWRTRAARARSSI